MNKPTTFADWWNGHRVQIPANADRAAYEKVWNASQEALLNSVLELEEEGEDASLVASETHG